MTFVDRPIDRRALIPELWVATRLTGILLLVAGVVYPLLLWSVSRVAFPRQAEGSLVYAGGRLVGSSLIGQSFTRPEYFHSRPSAVEYDAAASGGSNIGPTNPQLLAGNGGLYKGVLPYAAVYRRENGLRDDEALPSDAVTASGSGLDPHISPANAELQVARVATARRAALSRAVIRALVGAHTSGRTLGVIGEPRVNLLSLNMALDSASAAARGAP